MRESKVITKVSHL